MATNIAPKKKWYCSESWYKGLSGKGGCWDAGPDSVCAVVVVAAATVAAVAAAGCGARSAGVMHVAVMPSTSGTAWRTGCVLRARPLASALSVIQVVTAGTK